MNLNEFKKSHTNKWWYVQLWKINKHRKNVRLKFKYMFEALSERKNKDKFAKYDYKISENVGLYYWRYDEENENNENLGDFLSKIVVQYFKPKVVKTSNEQKYKTLYAIGSILGYRCQDAVVWGSGLMSEDPYFLQRVRFSSLDIRAVRGPKTRAQLLKLGKNCPEVYGDPAILMPKIYMPKSKEKKNDVSIVLHHEDKDVVVPDGIKKINIITNDYKGFIDEIVSSKLVISSSLHGVILAETYGVPAILLKREATKAPFKYEDWYNSTGRYDIVLANSVDQALKITPMRLPDLEHMQQTLLEVFPSDLWS